MERGILRGEKQCDLPDEQAEEKIENDKLYPFCKGDWLYVSCRIRGYCLIIKSRKILSGFFIMEKCRTTYHTFPTAIYNHKIYIIIFPKFCNSLESSL